VAKADELRSRRSDPGVRLRSAGDKSLTPLLVLDHDVTFEQIRLRFAVNGGQEQIQRVPTVARVCSTPDISVGCPAPDPPRF